jgi:putative transposase
VARREKKALWWHAGRETERECAWQAGPAAFSVSASQVPTVNRYVHNEEARHRKMSFEVRVLLRKHGVPYDAQFAPGAEWDPS